MKVAFHYPARCTGRAIDPVKIWTDDRGLTGSELSFVQYAQHLALRGHNVRVYGAFTTVYKVGDLLFFPDEAIPTSELQGFDATVHWMSADFDSRSKFRIYNEQCSDFGNAGQVWQDRVDLFCPLSHSHARHMSGQTGYPRDRYRVMPNGVDTEEFKPGTKQRGKVIWASSHDRGLHHLLAVWPALRRLCPWATLDVFYDTAGAERFSELPEEQLGVDCVRELKRRSCYQLGALERLRDHGVTLHGSVSRERIKNEMATAEVLAYPCDPVRYTETFGVSVLEAMASGCVPVLCFSDAFGELWGECAVGVHPPYPGKADAYLKILASVLTNDKHRASDAAHCRQHALRYDWSLLAAGLERCLETRGREGLSKVKW